MKEIPFLTTDDKLTKLDKGHSGASVYKVIRKNKTFLLKISPKVPKFSMVKISEKLQKLGIKTAKCHSELVKGDNFCVLYDFIEEQNGYTYSLQECEKFGHKVGEYLLKLKALDETLEKIDVKDVYNRTIDYINDYFQKVENLFGYDKQFFISKLTEYLKSFDEAPMSPIHGDIKFSNTLVCNNEIYLIDLDDLIYGYDAFNFQYTAQLFYSKNECDKIFMKKVLEALFHGNIPEYFHKNMKFMLIRKFFDRALYHIEMGNKNAYEELLELFKVIFENMFENEKLPLS